MPRAEGPRTDSSTAATPRPVESRQRTSTGDWPQGAIAWFTGNPVAANVLMALIVALGFAAAGDLPRESFPGLPPGIITVEVGFPSGSPEVAEEGVVLRLERALQGTPGIKRISSVARADGVTMTIEKASGIDLDRLLADVKARVDAVPNLPARAERPVLEQQRIDDRVIWAQVSGEVDRAVLEQVAHDLWRDLLAHPDIDQVDRVGHLSPEVHVEIDDASLAEYGLSLEDVATAIDRESLIDLSGSLRSPEGDLTLRAARRAVWAGEVSRLALLVRPDGSLLTVGDVASVRSAFQDSPRRFMRFDGQPSIGLQAFKDAATSTHEVSLAVREVVERWRGGGRLPRGVHLDTWYDRSEQITSRVALLQHNAIFGMALVFAVLALTLDRRVAFWVAMGLPVAFSGAFLVMRGFGLSLNDLTTFGMIVALGIVVDDAVVVGESIHTFKLREGNSTTSAVRGVQKVAVPTIFGVLTTVSAFSVLGLVKGEFGLIFSQFAMVTAGCLVFSLIESKLILPAHLAHLRLGYRPRSAFGRLFEALQSAVARCFDRLGVAYRALLYRALRRRYRSLFVILLVTGASLAFVAAGFVRSTFFPDIPGELVTATLTMEETAGHGLTEKNLALLESSLSRVAEGFGDSLGGDGDLLAAVQTQMTGDRSGEVRVEISPQLVGVAPGDIADAWRAETGPLEGAKTTIFSAAFDAFPPISLEISASDGTALRAARSAIFEHLQRTPGVRDLRDNLALGRFELSLELTPQGRALGLDTAGLSDQLQRAFLGYEVQRFQRGSEEVRVRVRYPAAERRDETDLTEARIRLPSGEAVPLSLVAETSFRRSSSEITRVDGNRVAILDAFVDRDLISPEEAVATLERDLLPDLRARYPGLAIQQRGELAEIAETSASIAWMLLLALASIFALLAVPLRSYSQPILIMAVIPFGILGAIFGHWVHGLPMSILSFFGLLALSGIVVNDSLLLVSTFNAKRESGLDDVEAWLDAGASRLRAICLTSVTTFAGLAPLILETSEHAQYLIPAAISIAYGILAATGITLVVLPVFQMIAEDLRRILSVETVFPESRNPSHGSHGI
ncbi:MAG: efflux RND transporter permease subunit [Acidobacteriota bacterium]